MRDYYSSLQLTYTFWTYSSLQLTCTFKTRYCCLYFLLFCSLLLPNCEGSQSVRLYFPRRFRMLRTLFLLNLFSSNNYCIEHFVTYLYCSILFPYLLMLIQGHNKSQKQNMRDLDIQGHLYNFPFEYECIRVFSLHHQPETGEPYLTPTCWFSAESMHQPLMRHTA